MNSPDTRKKGVSISEQNVWHVLLVCLTAIMKIHFIRICVLCWNEKQHLMVNFGTEITILLPYMIIDMV
jgi:hypothetical protein